MRIREEDLRTREELRRASGGLGTYRGRGALHGDGESRNKPGGESGPLMGHTMFSEGSRRHMDGHVQYVIGYLDLGLRTEVRPGM